MKRTAFTLPEILITLGAIGIVAAITIPVLFSNINNVKFRNQYKKAVSTLNQAALMAQANMNIILQERHRFAVMIKRSQENITQKRKCHSVQF